MGTVRDGKRLEKLTLAEPARALWKRVRQRLTELRHSEEAADPQAWMMGGGSVLAARWRHRTSTDIDLLTSARWQLRGLDATGSNALTRAMAALGGKLEGYNEATVELTFPERQRLHVFSSRPAPTAGQRQAIIDGEEFAVLSTTQILAGKLLNRSLRAPARDLYDMVLAGEREPQSLHHAVNMLSPEMQGNVSLMWLVRRDKIERNASVALKPISEREALAVRPADLVNRALAAIEAARYDHIGVVPAREGEPAAIVTTTGDGKATPIAVPHFELDDVLELTGMNHCLAARQMDREQFIDSLHTEREAPPRVGGNPDVPPPPPRPAAPRRAPNDHERDPTRSR